MTTERALRVGVTGAGGFIGRHAVARFAARGWDTHAFRRPGAAPTPGSTLHAFELGRELEPDAFAGLDVVIHCALAEYGPAQRDADELNRAGVATVIDRARRAGAHLVFLSTLSAHDQALSHYGHNKLELERRFDSARDCILRLGLVLGHGGLFGSMVDMIRGSRFIPLPDGGRQPIQTLWIEDLLDVLERVARERRHGRYELATAEVYTMRQLYSTVIARLGLQRTLVPVPLGLVGFGVGLLERLRVPFPIQSENVLGLRALRAFDNARDLEALGVHPISLSASVERLLPAAGGSDAVAFHSQIATEFDASYRSDPNRLERVRVWTALLDRHTNGARFAYDIGCGPGVLTREIARRGIETIGIDGAAGMLAVAEDAARREHVSGLTFQRHRLPIADTSGFRTAELVISSSVIEYLDSIPESLAFLRRLLAPGGTLIFSVSNRDSWSRTLVRTIHRLTGRPGYIGLIHHFMTPAELKSALGAADLTYVEHAYFGRADRLNRMLSRFLPDRFSSNMIVVVAKRA